MEAVVLRDILLRAKDLIIGGGRNCAYRYNSVLNGLGEAIEFLSHAELVDSNQNHTKKECVDNQSKQ